ncbi:aminoglycoside phosphotransferase family protein [Micromonospora sp. DR5-3]|uniref:phosphotransferase family protein n=1 Tax=unclassified Micromonospora TaxID=2617518 RepID=UPI0011D6D98F|nr:MULTISPECIES: phosphotransferase [unclassified Micromonospora]MCW3817420.1 aminoglycoside phosphotransferase family protein [Micromonospora sp. DR5-3]TYC22902.1 phosphotransferase [Micromonospora sp. MP36]
MRGAVQWAQPVLRDRLACWLHRPQRSWTAAVAPRLVARATATDDARWRTESVAFTSTSVAVATVGGRGTDGRFMVKVPWTDRAVEGLRRQAAVLDLLWTHPRLPGLRPLLPYCAAQGDVEGRYYCVEGALRGTPASGMMLRRARRAALLASASRVIRDLHRRTRERTLLDRAAVAEWVDVPLRRLEAFAATRPRGARFLDTVWRLREELVLALVGRTVHTSWIHGDLWPGNLLATSPDGQVTGIVDWDQASARQLPLHDLLHLHVLARRLARGDELGEIVVEALRHGIDRALDVPADEAADWLDGIPPRPALLLYWLRHILLFIDSEGDHDDPRWIRGNVERVLASV